MTRGTSGGDTRVSARDAAGPRLSRRRFLQSAGAVGATFAVPTIIIPRAVTLDLWIHQYNPNQEVYTKYVFPAAKKKLGIDVKLTYQQEQYYITQMIPQIATGGGPDVFEIPFANQVQFAQSGVAAEVDYGPWGGRSKYMKFWQPGAVEYNQVSGKDFFVPTGTGGVPNALFLNSADAEAAGLDWQKYQKTPISWAELGPWAAKMTQRDANGNITRSGFGIQTGYGYARDYSFWQPYFWQAGGSETSKDGKKSTLNSKSGIEAMQYLYDCVYKYGASAPRTANGVSGSALMPQHQMSCTIAMSIWAYPTFQTLAPTTYKDIRALLHPQVDPAHPKYFTGAGYNLTVPASSSHKKAAFEFIHLVASEFPQEWWNVAGEVIPLRNWANKVSWSSLEDSAVWHKMSAEGTLHKSSAKVQLTDAYREKEFQSAFEAVLYEKKPVEAELNSWNKLVQQQIASQFGGS